MTTVGTEDRYTYSGRFGDVPVSQPLQATSKIVRLVPPFGPDLFIEYNNNMFFRGDILGADTTLSGTQDRRPNSSTTYETMVVKSRGYADGFHDAVTNGDSFNCYCYSLETPLPATLNSWCAYVPGFTTWNKTYGMTEGKIIGGPTTLPARCRWIYDYPQTRTAFDSAHSGFAVARENILLDGPNVTSPAQWPSNIYARLYIDNVNKKLYGLDAVTPGAEFAVVGVPALNTAFPGFFRRTTRVTCSLIDQVLRIKVDSSALRNWKVVRWDITAAAYVVLDSWSSTGPTYRTLALLSSQMDQLRISEPLYLLDDVGFGGEALLWAPLVNLMGVAPHPGADGEVCPVLAIEIGAWP